MQSYLLFVGTSLKKKKSRFSENAMQIFLCMRKDLIIRDTSDFIVGHFIGICRFAGRCLIDVPMQRIAKVISNLKNRFHYDPMLQVNAQLCSSMI